MAPPRSAGAARADRSRRFSGKGRLNPGVDPFEDLYPTRRVPEVGDPDLESHAKTPLLYSNVHNIPARAPAGTIR